MTALDKIVKYLKSRKTGATAPEIAKYAKVNYNTVRKLLGLHSGFDGVFYPLNHSKCQVTNKYLTTYKLA